MYIFVRKQVDVLFTRMKEEFCSVLCSQKIYFCLAFPVDIILTTA